MTTTKIPKEQWAQVLEAINGPVTYKKIPVREPGPDEVLVNVKYSGVCHSDLHVLHSDWALEAKLPLVGGHEGAGIVVARGSLSDEPLCEKAQLSGYTVDGTFQQYAIAKAAHVARIPKDCKLDAVAPILCAGITVYKGIKESGVRPGQYLVVVGAGGGLGSLAIQYARAMGIEVIAIDGGDEKKDLCLKLGASTYVDFLTSKNLVADVKAATADGLGPHATLILAVSPKPFQQATEYIRARGVVVCIGMPPNTMFSAPVFDTVLRMITIKGSYVGNRLDTAEAIEFFRKGLIHAPYQTVGLSKLQEVYKIMEEGKVIGRYVVDTSR
ncbi:hypothetical protein ACCO45_002703 [Purpureocillium lilacinum]|uniref:Uncharacterized protein n=1 Tax=Purpureocillium lilacinum TaxID=33203 RepID=A0ACC4DXV2_PURLI